MLLPCGVPCKIIYTLNHKVSFRQLQGDNIGKTEKFLQYVLTYVK